MGLGNIRIRNSAHSAHPNQSQSHPSPWFRWLIRAWRIFPSSDSNESDRAGRYRPSRLTTRRDTTAGGNSRITTTFESRWYTEALFHHTYNYVNSQSLSGFYPDGVLGNIRMRIFARCCITAPPVMVGLNPLPSPQASSPPCGGAALAASPAQENIYIKGKKKDKERDKGKEQEIYIYISEIQPPRTR